MIGNAMKIINFLYQYIKDDDLVFEVKKYKPKRSLSQNSYAWELIGKLADAMTMSKEDTYFMMLQEYGQSMLIPVEPGKKPDGYFKYYMFHGQSVLNGKKATWYKVYKGSSEFDTSEMSIFINGIIQECTNLGIPTLTEDQVKEMRLV